MNLKKQNFALQYLIFVRLISLQRHQPGRDRVPAGAGRDDAGEAAHLVRLGEPVRELPVRDPAGFLQAAVLDAQQQYAAGKFSRSAIRSSHSSRECVKKVGLTVPGPGSTFFAPGHGFSGIFMGRIVWKVCALVYLRNWAFDDGLLLPGKRSSSYVK